MKIPSCLRVNRLYHLFCLLIVEQIPICSWIHPLMVSWFEWCFWHHFNILMKSFLWIYNFILVWNYMKPHRFHLVLCKLFTPTITNFHDTNSWHPHVEYPLKKKNSIQFRTMEEVPISYYCIWVTNSIFIYFCIDKFVVTFVKNNYPSLSCSFKYNSNCSHVH